MNWQTHVPNIFGIGFNVTFIRFLHFFSLSIILNMIILQPVSSSESSSQKSMIIGSMTLLSIQFSLQYSFSILTTCSSAFVHTSFVIFPKAAYVSSLTSFNRKVVLFFATKPLTCAHINYIGLSSQCRTGVLNTSCSCKLAILSVL